MKANNHNSTNGVLVQESRDAYLKHEPAMRRLDKSELVRINVDVLKAAKIVIASAIRARPYASAIAKLYDMHEQDVEALKELGQATLFAHTVARRGNEDALADVADEGYSVRSDLMQAANLLVSRGRLDGAAIAKVSMKRSYDDLWMALEVLVEALANNTDDEMQAAIVSDEALAKARKIRDDLLSRIIMRDGGIEAMRSPDAAEMKHRAFSLMRDKHRAVRRALDYAVGNTVDINEIMPPLINNRKSGEPTLVATASEAAIDLDHASLEFVETQPVLTSELDDTTPVIEVAPPQPASTSTTTDSTDSPAADSPAPIPATSESVTPQPTSSEGASRDERCATVPAAVPTGMPTIARCARGRTVQPGLRAQRRVDPRPLRRLAFVRAVGQPAS